MKRVALALSIVTVVCTLIGFGADYLRDRHPYVDSYACFGGGRYDAMRDGRVCPGAEDQ